MKRLLFLLFLVSAPLALSAQGYTAPDVVVSKEKANIAGKVYYVHKVLPKQTIFSICKAYGITSDQLSAANPDLGGGLKAGSIIFIPVDQAKIPEETAATPRPKTQVKTAPVTEKAEEKVETEKPAGDKVVTRVIEHRVRWYESLSGIARKYGISEGELLDYNGLTRSDSIKGKVLLVPVMGDMEFDEDEEIDESDIDKEKIEENGEETEEPMHPVRPIRWFSAEEPLHISLILPFNLSSGSASSNFLNFYSGALMAIQEQKEKGAHLVVNVYDLAQGANSIIQDPKFQESDLIIGPVEAPTMKPFLDYSDSNGTAFVSPLDHKVDSLVDFHPFLFQVPAHARVQLRNLVESLHARPGDRVLLVASTSGSDSGFISDMEADLRSLGISYRKVSLGEVSSLVSGGTAANPVKIIIGSESKSFSTEAVRSLNSLSKRGGGHFEVWGTNRVRNYETSDPDALFNIRFHTSVPYFVDYTNSADQAFVLRYRAMFYAEPDDFAFQGYDVFTYFITAMTQQGTGIINHADIVPMQLLHCNFQFARDYEESGWRNRATRNLVYEKEGFSISISK